MFPDEVRKTVIGLARDLRGLVFAFNTKVSYMMLFEWLYPTYTPILHRAVEIWYQDPQVRDRPYQPEVGFLNGQTCYLAK